MTGRFRQWLMPPYATAVGNLRLMPIPLLLTVSGLFAFIDEDHRGSWAGERTIALAVVVGGAITGALHARHQRRTVRARPSRTQQALDDLSKPWTTLIAYDLPAFAALFAVYLLPGRWTWTFLAGALLGAHLLFIPVARMLLYPDEREWRRTEGQKAVSAPTPTGRPRQRPRRPRARR